MISCKSLIYNDRSVNSIEILEVLQSVQVAQITKVWTPEGSGCDSETLCIPSIHSVRSCCCWILIEQQAVLGAQLPFYLRWWDECQLLVLKQKK